MGYLNIGRIETKKAKYGKYIFGLMQNKEKILGVVEFEKKYKVNHTTIKKDLEKRFYKNFKNKTKIFISDKEKTFLNDFWDFLQEENKKEKLTIKKFYMILYLMYYFIKFFK